MFSGVNHPQILRRILEKTPLQGRVPFKAGEVFEGTVVRRLSCEEVLISAKSGPFRAVTDLELHEGVRRHFHVRALEPRVELEVLDSEPGGERRPPGDRASLRTSRDNFLRILADLSGLRGHRSLTAETRTALNNLDRLLPALGPGKGNSGGHQRLMNQILGSGIFWESKVARYLRGEGKDPWAGTAAGDLKGILLSLARSLSGAEGQDPQMHHLALRAEEALQMIEQDQFLNLSAIREDAGWFFFLPGFRDRGFQRAEVFVEGREAEGSLTFHMVAHFTKLGEMEVSVHILKGVVQVKMFMEDEAKASYVSEHLFLLENALEGAGLKAGFLSCSVRETDDENGMSPVKGAQVSDPVHLII
ncbi:MAG: hypothetical protein ACOWYE_16395 [Desulfatiglandales bacterium]